MAIQVKNIKYVIDELARPAILKDILQRLKAGGAVGLERQPLRRRASPARRQTAGGSGEFRKS